MTTQGPESSHEIGGVKPRGYALPFPWLVADVGATNARFAWIDGDPGDVRLSRVFPIADFPEPVDAVRAYLSEIAALLGADFRSPRWACLAVAAPVQGDVAVLTNCGWRFSALELSGGLGLDGVFLLNDFEALAWSLPGLRHGQFRAQGPVMPRAGALAVVGPGTGLGVAGIVPWGENWVTVPGEGGHATLAPGDDFESAVLERARPRLTHVSAERLLSGGGLPTLVASVAEVLGRPPEEISAAQVLERGLDRRDEVCDRTIDLFCAWLGGFCGNVALTLGARGGLFVGGGIVPRLGERFFASAFRERFEAKGRFRPYLQAIPTALITDTLVALGGAAAALEQRLRRPAAR